MVRCDHHSTTSGQEKRPTGVGDWRPLAIAAIGQRKAAHRRPTGEVRRSGAGSDVWARRPGCRVRPCPDSPWRRRCAASRSRSAGARPRPARASAATAARRAGASAASCPRWPSRVAPTTSANQEIRSVRQIRFRRFRRSAASLNIDSSSLRWLSSPNTLKDDTKFYSMSFLRVPSGQGWSAVFLWKMEKKTKLSEVTSDQIKTWRRLLLILPVDFDQVAISCFNTCPKRVWFVNQVGAIFSTAILLNFSTAESDAFNATRIEFRYKWTNLPTKRKHFSFAIAISSYWNRSLFWFCEWLRKSRTFNQDCRVQCVVFFKAIKIVSHSFTYGLNIHW